MILEEIIRLRKIAVEKAKAAVPQSKLGPAVARTGLPFLRKREAGQAVQVLAELKRRSPSRGAIAADLAAAERCRLYQEAGASALSVLTENEHFGGSIEDLQAARATCKIPILQKDFFVEPYQIHQAASLGVDAILLIAAALDRSQLHSFARLADSLGLATLVEIHSEEELEKALSIQPQFLGVNCRDLKTFDLDPGLFGRLRNRLPEDIVLVAESGMLTVEDVRKVHDLGYDAVLIGEALSRAPEPAAFLDAIRRLGGQA